MKDLREGIFKNKYLKYKKKYIDLKIIQKYSKSKRW